MKKILITMIVSLSLMTIATQHAFAQDLTPVNVLVNGQKLKLDAFIVNDKTFVPVRAISEAFSASVSYQTMNINDTVTGVIDIKRNEKTIHFPVGSNEVTVNGNTVLFDEPAQLIGDTAYVPLRFVTDIFGSEIKWNDETRTVSLASNDFTQNEEIFSPKPGEEHTRYTSDEWNRRIQLEREMTQQKMQDERKRLDEQKRLMDQQKAEEKQKQDEQDRLVSEWQKKRADKILNQNIHDKVDLTEANMKRIGQTLFWKDAQNTLQPNNPNRNKDFDSLSYYEKVLDVVFINEHVEVIKDKFSYKTEFVMLLKNWDTDKVTIQTGTRQFDVTYRDNKQAYVMFNYNTCGCSGTSIDSGNQLILYMKYFSNIRQE
jgi:hypothetical protein